MNLTWVNGFVLLGCDYSKREVKRGGVLGSEGHH